MQSRCAAADRPAIRIRAINRTHEGVACEGHIHSRINCSSLYLCHINTRPTRDSDHESRKMIQLCTHRIGLGCHIPTCNGFSICQSSRVLGIFDLHVLLILRLWQSHSISEGPVGHIRCDVIRLVRKRMQARNLFRCQSDFFNRKFSRIFRKLGESDGHLIILRGDIFLAKHDRTPGRLFVAVRDPFGNDPLGRRLTGSIHGRCRRYGSSWDDRWC